jgi:hypothetical protein
MVFSYGSAVRHSYQSPTMICLPPARGAMFLAYAVELTKCLSWSLSPYPLILVALESLYTLRRGGCSTTLVVTIGGAEGP